MNRKPKHDDPVVIPFRPRPKPPKAPAPWMRSLTFFLVMLGVVGLLRALYVGMVFSMYDSLFVVLLAGALSYGEFVTRRR